jgi:L-serine kinase (ATP) / ParB family transcriptional regulator, heme-responsive regulator
MSRQDASDLRFPRLRFVPLELLIPHEREDLRRTTSLTERLQESGVLRNPPIITPGTSVGDARRFVVLDGANRVSTLRALGYPHVVAQIVDYEEPAVRLSTWHHALVDLPLCDLERELAGTPGLTICKEDLSHARALLARRESIAFIRCAETATTLSLHGGHDLHERNRILNAVVDLYRGVRPYHRVTRDSLEEARASDPKVTSLVVFPRFDPDEILEIALSGARLPAGITRHVIAWRALRVNIPLAILSDKAQAIEAKNTWLERWVSEREAQNSIRFYEESTVLFDE